MVQFFCPTVYIVQQVTNVSQHYEHQTCLNSVTGAGRQKDVVVIGRNSSIALRDVLRNVSARNVNTKAVTVGTCQAETTHSYNDTKAVTVRTCQAETTHSYNDTKAVTVGTCQAETTHSYNDTKAVTVRTCQEETTHSYNDTKAVTVRTCQAETTHSKSVPVKCSKKVKHRKK